MLGTRYCLLVSRFAVGEEQSPSRLVISGTLRFLSNALNRANTIKGLLLEGSIEYEGLQCPDWVKATCRQAYFTTQDHEGHT